MIVVSDTSPLTALLTVGEAELLPRLFQEVVIPEAVRKELLRAHSRLPDWLRALAVRDTARVARFAALVDAGEAEAIGLARELRPTGCCWTNARAGGWPCGRACR